MARRAARRWPSWRSPTSRARAGRATSCRSVYFTDTLVDYRDDNRHLWRFHELSDDEEMFAENRPASASAEIDRLPPRHYPEWDHHSQSYRPDWVSLYESLHPAGDAALIDRLLDRHAALARRLKRLLDILKPQERVRLRYQEDGSELDLDVAVRSLIDFKQRRHARSADQHEPPQQRSQPRRPAAPRSFRVAGRQGRRWRWRADGARTQSGGGVAARLVDRPARRPVRHRRLPFGHPARRPLPASQGQQRALGRRRQAPPGGDAGRLFDAHRRRHAARGALPRGEQAEKKLLLVLTDGRPSDVDVPTTGC
jgi:nitric oxide reductase NorD protein